MKKQITAVLIAALITVLAVMSASAQGRSCKGDRGEYRGNSRNLVDGPRGNKRNFNPEYRGNSRNRRTEYPGSYRNSNVYNDSGYYNTPYYGVSQPNVYDRHRKAFNLAIGSGAGAAVGGIVGGRRGALIGTGIGLAGGAIVTAVQKPRNYPKPRY